MIGASKKQAWATIGRSACVVLILLATASAACACDFGKFSAGCLTTDSALKNNEGLAPLDAAAVVTISPAELWPPNRRFSDVHIGMSLPGAIQLNSAIAVSLTVNGITDDQVSEDDAGGPGCRPPTNKQGADWSPVASGGLFASGNLQTASDTVSIMGVQLRRERCSNLGTRTYQISFTCCDTTHAVCDSSPEALNVLVPKVNTGGLHHYEYVLSDANLYVYDMDDHFNAVKHLSIPTGAGVRGAVASAVTGRLYVSYGSDNTSGGSMLAYDLTQDRILWAENYPFGIDSMSISPDGSKIYMPTGELATGGIWQRLGLASGGIWETLDARTGDVIGSIDSGGRGPHNTVVSRDGHYVFMGPRGSDYLVMADTPTNTVIRQIGPVANGVRPFTINSHATLAFITTTGSLGFSVGDINRGTILYTIQVQGFPTTGGAATAPSHGISLSPDERKYT
jgi:hypothetical protein